MRKFTFILSLLVAFATTALAQGTILSSSELNALTSSKKVAVKNLSGTNNRWLALTSSVEELTPEALLVVEPISDGTFYLKRASEADSYVQAAASGAITLGAQATAQVFTAATPSAPGNETLADGSDLDKLVRFVQNGASTWLNCQNQANAPILGNTGQGSWTMHNVYDMSNYYVLTINEVVDGATTVVKKVVEAGAAINVDKDGYTHDYAASTMPAADTEITVNYTVDGGEETPEPVTSLVKISTADEIYYYRIDSYNRGGCLTNMGDGAAVQHVTATDGSYWYFTKANDNGGVYFNNFTSEQCLGDGYKMSDTPAVWYVLENGVNENGYSISSTNPISSSSCIDANNWSSGVGSWNPSANDWEGTTWVFVEVDAPKQTIPGTVGKEQTSLAGTWDWTSGDGWSTPAEGYDYADVVAASQGADIDGSTFDGTGIVYLEQSLTVTDNGNVGVSFVWDGGNHRIDVLGVDLVKDGSIVYKHYAVGFSGGGRIPVEYTMENVEAGTYTLRYFATTQANNTNSKGNITITYTEVATTPDPEPTPDEVIISSLADANPNKAYTATTQRASWAVDTEGTVIGTTSELNAEDLNHQFAFIKGSDDNYYLWSVGAGKFVTPSAALSATLCKPIQFNDGSSVEAGRVVVQFADNANGYFNINGEKNLVIDSWSTADAGNAVKFVEVADFNPATAEAALEAYLTTGVYKEELNAVIAELDVIVAGVGTQIGYYTSSDADYASKLAAIKEFAAAMDGKTAEEIQTQTAAAEALKATFSLILPTAGNYYFIKNNTNVWTSDLAVYANGTAPGWKAFNEEDVNFWWKAETVDGGIAFKNVATGTYIAGNEYQSVAWTLSETATAITFANMGAAANGNAIMSLTLGHMMHANGHGGGSNTSGNIVGWDAQGASTASGWELVEGDGTKLADLYRSTVEAAITELNSMKSLLGDSYGSYSCDDELMAQVEAFDVAAATYEELVAMYAVIGQLRTSFKINSPEVGVSYVRIKAGVTGWNDDNPYLGSANSTAKDGRAEFIATADANSIFFYCEDKCLVSYASGQHLVNNGNFLGYNSDLTVAGAAVSFGSAETFGRYSISFIGNNESARALYIHQSDYTDAATPGATGDGYTFALEAVTSLPVTVTSAGYATFYAPVAVTIPAGVKAFYATAINGDYVSLVEVTGTIPANTGVILKAEAATYSFVIAEDVDAIENNLLDGTIAKEVLTKEGTGNYYVLGVVDGVVGMYNPVKGEDNTTFINAGHKAYMYVEGAARSAGYRFDFSGTTGISEIETENAADAVIYDLTGRRVNDTNRPGIYIVNGKKILVK